MKTVILAFLLSLAGPAMAEKIFLDVGEMTTKGGAEIYCGAHQTEPETFCECRPKAGSGLGECRRGYYDLVLVQKSSSGREKTKNLGTFSNCSSNGAVDCQNELERRPECSF